MSIETKIYKSRIDGTEFSITLNSKFSYGMMLSGGLDSAILFYIILKQFKELGWTPKIRPFTMRKTNERIETANLMVDYLNSKFPEYKIPYTTVIGDPNVHHRLQGVAAWEEIVVTHLDINRIFYASNKVPDWDYSDFPLDQFGLPRGRPERSKGEGGYVLLPILNLYKFHTVDLVSEYEQEEIFTLSRSCTQSVEGPRCGQCFHCNERAWGFKHAKIQDPGNG